MKNNAAGDDDDDEDWGEDELTPAVAQLDINIKGMIQTDDLDKPLAERCDQFSAIVDKRKLENKLTDINDIKDLVAEAERLEIMEQAAFLVAQSVFTDNILKEIEQYKSLFEKVNNFQSEIPDHIFRLTFSYVQRTPKDKSICYMLSKY